MPTLLLRSADFLVQDAERFIRGGALYIEEGIIRDVGPSAELEKRYRADESIDLSGCIVTPGLVNAHNHLYEIMSRGLGKDFGTEGWLAKAIYPIDRFMGGDDYYHAALVALADCLRQGTTAVIEQLTNYARFHADREVEAYLQCGIRGAVARASTNRSTIDAGEERPEEEDLKASEAFLKRWTGRPRVSPWLGPSGLFSCTPDLLKRLKDMSTDHGARFTIHLNETRIQAELARGEGFVGQIAQADQIGLLDERTLIAHAVWAGEEELALAGRAGAQIVHNPSSNMILASGVADVPKMVELGIPVGIGTDGPASNDSLDMVAEMKAAVLLQRVNTINPIVLNARDVFRMGTETGARILGVETLGRLEPGWTADVAAFRIAPGMVPVYEPAETLIYSGSGRDACLTVVDGEVLYRDGRFTRFDLQESLDHVNRTAEEIRVKVPQAFPEPVGADKGAVSD